ncbi:MAG: transcription termination/antitermination factor NusG [Lachnospiraceae bacterium]|nr:transcription termination/antitermination factor NusG [Lachnospiraceae bacterium]MBO4558562.1 transcription termination/antitermination factor NusG [Lachnospiraceae bacterium]MBR5733141.1 transcription termination/antitermination factor NusG [Lachnospiraceae bacterium]MBR5967202.1 transcription termination/antitermination factor NusG [Lachnospiraceae bacterium]
MAEAKWYVVHTYSGYENKVMLDLKKTIENRGLQDQILDVSVPVQTVTEIRSGVKKQVEKKMFPGYVLINMIMNDDTWYIVRNTRGVTGFVGPGSKPVPLSQEEMDAMNNGPSEILLDFEEGDTVTIINGTWKDSQGVVRAIDLDAQTVTINIDMFGRETPVELGLTDVRSDN